jgi:hypothetical protein
MRQTLAESALHEWFTDAVIGALAAVSAHQS